MTQQQKSMMVMKNHLTELTVNYNIIGVYNMIVFNIQQVENFISVIPTCSTASCPKCFL